MDVNEDSSHPSITESQPTQLLHNVLSGNTASAPGSTDPAAPHPVSAMSETSRKHSSDSSDQGIVPPKYHFHGLASSQSQNVEGGGETGGSQKENASDVQDQSHPPSTRIIPRSKVSDAEPPKLSQPNIRTGEPAPVAKAPKSAVKGPSARAVAREMKIITSNLSPPQLRNSGNENEPSSQDSFADPVSQDPVRAFITNNSAFEVPLSELARPSTQDARSHATVTSPVRPPPGIVRAIPHSDRILVENTPSNSGDSQSQSHQILPPQTQLVSTSQSQGGGQSLDPDVSLIGGQNPLYAADIIEYSTVVQQSTQGDELSQPSSSYERLLAGEPEPEESTQPVQDTPTQPSPSAGFDAGPPTPPSHEGDPETPFLGTVAPRVNVPSDPRSILNMVDPKKAWRYTRVAQARPGYHPSTARSIPVTVPETPQIGQASGRGLVTMAQSDFVPETPHAGPSRKHANLTDVATQLTIVPPPVPAPQKARRPDSMDVVPDSDPPRPRTDATCPEPSEQPKARRKNPQVVQSDDEPSKPVVPDPIALRKEEEETEDEDDAPLATVADRLKGKEKATTSKDGAGMAQGQERTIHPGKAKMVSKGREKAVSKEKERAAGKGKTVRQADDQFAMPPPPLKEKPSAARMKAKPAVAEVAATRKETRPNSSSKRKRPPPGEVPSSAPEQDSRVPRGTTPTQGVPACDPSKTRYRSRSTSTAPSLAKKRRIATDSDNETYSTRPDSALSKEEGTEPDEEIETNPNLATLSRKTRQQTKTSTNIVSRTSTRMSSRSFNVSVPRRLHSSLSGDRVLGVLPTRVIALWKRDGHYYSGVVQRHIGGSQYIVQFDDNTEDAVSLSDMRRGDLQKGDTVMLIKGRQRATVVDVTARGMVSLEADRRGELEELEVEVAEVRIASRTITSQWQDRTLDAAAVITREDAENIRSRDRSILAKTGLVMTLSPGTSNADDLKRQTKNVVEMNGGILLEDFSDVISMPGKAPKSKHSWVAEGNGISWKGQGIDRLFLLSDGASQKPKYLEAIALGVPCLSMNWLYDLVASSSGAVDWQPYLLPQGYATALSARVSQFVDFDWCNSPEHLQQIMSNAVSPKPLSSKSVLCIQAEYLPEKKNAASAVPRIMLAMGSRRLEVVSQAKYASQNLSLYDLVVVKEGEKAAYEKDVVCVDFSWIKACLIAGRLLDLPASAK